MKMDGTNLMEVIVRNTYGQERIYPANKVAELFANLLGKKTFSDEDLRLIRDLGVLVEEVFERRIK